jgi:crotonobetainyl-CoA:carnitine CoA-transferase CaiB-like acyl-CoA transferase
LRVANEPALKQLIAPIVATRTRSEWIQQLAAAGVPCGAVRSVAEALSDPQVAARHMTETVEHAVLGSIKVLGTPIKLSDTSSAVRTAPPVLGQHTDAVLTELGLTGTEIALLRNGGVV